MKYEIIDTKYGRVCSIKNCNSHVYNYLKAGKVYEEETLKFMRKYGAGREIIHAGAYIGDFFPVLSPVAKKIWSFEPVLAHYECALETIRLNNIDNITLSRCMIGENKKKSIIQTHNRFGENMYGGAREQSFEFMQKIPLAKYEEVDVITLNELPVKDLAIIQLDLEGNEVKALKGATEIIQKYKPIIITESLFKGFAPDKIIKNEWINKNLLMKGYKVADFVNINANVVFHPKEMNITK